MAACEPVSEGPLGSLHDFLLQGEGAQRGGHDSMDL